MTSLFSPFSRSRAGDAWFSVGPATSFPDITSADGTQVSDLRPCTDINKKRPGCKVFHVPKDDGSKATEVPPDGIEALSGAGDLQDQVMIFRYKGKFHAINHVSNKTEAWETP